MSEQLHRWARPFVIEALELENIDPTPVTVVLAVQAVGDLETAYATSWRGAGVGSRNWGAVQRGRPPCDPTKSFLYQDSSPNPDGTSTKYEICFRKYATDADGARGLVHEVYTRRPRVLSTAQRGSLADASVELWRARFYEGFGRTIADRIGHHYARLFSCASSIAHACGDAPPAPESLMHELWEYDLLDPYPVIKRGSPLHSIVKVAQRELNEEVNAGRLHGDLLVVDGQFGQHTEHAVAAFQAAQGLKIDGVVGDETWNKLFELAP